MKRYLLPTLLLLLGLTLVLLYIGQRWLLAGDDTPATPPTQPALAQVTATATALNTPTLWPSPTNSLTPTSTPTNTPTSTPTNTPTSTPTQTPSPTFTPTSTPTSTPPPQPIVPTLTPTLEATAVISGTATAVLTPTATLSPPTITPTPSPTSTPTRPPLTTAELSRFGIGAAHWSINRAYNAGLPVYNYLTWSISPDPFQPRPDVQYWQMVRVRQSGLITPWSDLEEAVLAQPGSVWIVGNEPDVIWQDNVTPDRYAHIYHEVYTYIKGLDPTAQLAIAGVTQPTPLRIAYLEIVLDTYQRAYGRPMPIDIWTVHAFILREEAGSWGVDIPPGMPVRQGELYEIDDHDDLTIFRQNLLDFRAWLAERGYGDRPLAVTEYGILHPPDFGFSPERVAEFMHQTFNFFLTERGVNGYGADEDRLFQWWFWYSVHDRDDFPTGNLLAIEDGDRLTPIGEAFAAYLEER